MVGAGDFRQAQELVRLALWRGLLIAVAVSVASALAGPPLLALFTQDAQIVALGATLL